MFPTGWQRRVSLTVPAALVGTAGVTDFTVQILRSDLPDEMVSPTDSNRAQADGGDIRFSSDAAGVNRIAVDVTRWEYDSAHGNADAVVDLNVKVPSLSDATATVIYCWYNTAASESQPAASDTYGAKNAYDANHCHRYPMSEDPAGAAPQFADSINGRDLTVVGTGGVRVNGQLTEAFDGNGSAMARCDFAGFETPGGFTNTGLTKLPGENTLGVVNFDDTEIWEIDSTDGTSKGTEFDVSASGVTSPQGLAWDSVDSRWVTLNNTGSILYRFERNGTFDNSFGFSGGSNAVGYDSDLDQYIVSKSTGQLAWINKSGAEQSTLTFTGDAAGIAIEGVSYSADTSTVWVTSDTGNLVYEINKSTGGTIRSYRGPFDIEHPAYDDDNDVLWVNGDAGFHSSYFNVIYKLDPTTGQPADWPAPETEYEVEYWINPESTATAIMFAFYAAVKAEAFYHEDQIRTGGQLRTYDTDVIDLRAFSALTLNTWQWVNIHYEAATQDLTVEVDNVVAATDMLAAGDFGPDGRLSVLGRPDNTLRHNGAIEDVRVHKVNRGAAWRTTRYNNMTDAGFFVVGTPESPGATGNHGPLFHRRKNLLANPIYRR